MMQPEATLWAGRILALLVVLILCGIKRLKLGTAVEATTGPGEYRVTVLFGVVVWLGIHLRKPALQAFVPLRSRIAEPQPAAARAR